MSNNQWMTRIALLVVVAWLLPVTAQAQAVAGDQLVSPLTTHRELAGAISNATVATALALDTWDSFKAEDRSRALLLQGVRTGVVLGVTEAVKRLVHRERPDGSDQLSFYSEHTAFAASTLTRRRFAFTFPLTIGTAEGRIGAGKHYLTDTLVGFIAGALAGRIR